MVHEFVNLQVWASQRPRERKGLPETEPGGRAWEMLSDTCRELRDPWVYPPGHVRLHALNVNRRLP